MDKYGYVRLAAAVPPVKVADCSHNAEEIEKLIKKADNAKVDVIVFPELSITGYTCADLFHQHRLLNGAVEALLKLAESTALLEVTAVVGMPVAVDNQIFNCGVVLQKGKVLGVVPKTNIPGYKEYYEERWFASGKQSIQREIGLLGAMVPFGIDLLFQAAGNPDFCFGIEMCEDLWVPIPPSSFQSLAGATILLNLSASNESIGKMEYRRELVRQQSGRCIAGYVYASAGIGESTTDVVFGGHSIISENGSMVAESERFVSEPTLIIGEVDVEKLTADRQKTTSYMEGVLSDKINFRRIPFSLRSDSFEAHKETLLRKPVRFPFVPSNESDRDRRCEEIFAIQVCGLAKRLEHTGTEKAVIGISGGLDSTLALLVTVKAFDRLGISRSNIQGITMPGFGTTGRTYNNAISLMKNLGVNVQDIDIKPACLQHFKDIGHDPSILDVTYENVQARERTQVLMDIANKTGGFVIGTGDLSELALGWATYNGDHMSMYAVNCSVPKTLVKYLVRWVADHSNSSDEVQRILLDILDTPVSPELLPADSKGEIKQKTEDIVGPYELHDFYLYYFLRYGFRPEKILYLANQTFEGHYDKDVIKKWLITFYKRFFSQQYKRSCLPDGPKVGSVSLSPRGDWRMPSDASVNLWLEELEGL